VIELGAPVLIETGTLADNLLKHEVLEVLNENTAEYGLYPQALFDLTLQK